MDREIIDRKYSPFVKLNHSIGTSIGGIERECRTITGYP